MPALLLTTLMALTTPGNPPVAPAGREAPGWGPASQPTVTLTVTVTGVRSDAGAVEVALFATADGFPTNPERAKARLRVTVHEGQAVAVFPALEPGAYAVATYHDENANGRLDTRLFGIPKEGTAASNDAKGRMGPPSFDAARIEVAVSRGITIRMAY